MNKIIMVGMNPKTRHLIPWDADAEIWTLNEGTTKDWMKRWDVLYQIHPRWDWDRANNLSDPNHPLFIKGVDGQCLFCKGEGKARAGSEDIPCPWCDNGVYHVPEHRHGKKIVMQDVNEDVPGCLRYPIASVTDEGPDEKPYLTSTLAHMLAYAIAFHPSAPIELYGFEAESGTEYAQQRPCIEYWIGYGRGQGMSIEAPGSGLMTGKHYGYEDFDQGYRTRLELRKRQLQVQLNAAEVDSISSEGGLKALTPFKAVDEMRPYWEASFDDHFKKKNFVSFLRGAIKEIEHSIEILDAYRQDSAEATQADTRRLIEIPYQLG